MHALSHSDIHKPLHPDGSRILSQIFGSILLFIDDDRRSAGPEEAFMLIQYFPLLHVDPSCKSLDLLCPNDLLGWQPGIPEVSSVWDEDWDKFEDEGRHQ